MAAPSGELLLAGLDDQQRIAATALLGPVCLLAGAGTGKTRAITHRIAYGVATGVYPPARVLALTFTSRAAGELRGRLASLGTPGVSTRTFHAAALSQLNFFWPQVIGGTMPRLVEGKARLIAQAAEALRVKLDTATLRDVAAEIEWRKTALLSIEQWTQAKRPTPPALTSERMVALQQGYERLKDERRQLDFEDVLLAAAGMLEAEPRVADQVREQYRFFVVDEYQDVSPLQHHLLRLWLGPRTDICVVGDVSQTIYSFAGASPDFLLGFEREHPGSVVVRLEQNYRSTRSIVTAANRLMQGHPGALSLRAVDENPAPIPKMVAHESDGSEARSVANQIAAQIDAGAAPESIAVLFRIGAQSQVIETALGDAGVPFRVRGALRFFDQREVKEALMLLRGASITTAEEPLFKTVSDVLRSIGWSQDPPDVRGAVRDRWEALDVLMRLAESSTAGTTLKQFVAEMLDRQSAQQEPTMPAVTLSTLHSAKGLEWDSVYIIGLVEGLIPITYAKDAAALDEERRLLYVGMTRARRTLALSWALSPQAGRAVARIPSRFIADLR